MKNPTFRPVRRLLLGVLCTVLPVAFMSQVPVEAIDTARSRRSALSRASSSSAVAAVLSATSAPLDMDAIAAHFKAKGRWRDRLPVILDTLVAIGRVRQQGETYASC